MVRGSSLLCAALIGSASAQTWTGLAQTFTYTDGTACSAGQSSVAASDTTAIVRMDALNSCAEQTTPGGQPWFNKWTCSGNGKITSVGCTDSTCSSCNGAGNEYSVQFVDTGIIGGERGACLDPSDPSKSPLAYMLFPPRGDASYDAAMPACMVAPARPLPQWSGSADTFTYTTGSSCSAGRSLAPVSETTVIQQMDQGDSACATQTTAGTGAPYFAKWTCAQSAPGGTITSVGCTNASCTSCTGTGRTFSVSFVPAGQDDGACLQPSDTSLPSYMLFPPGKADPVYESAMASCMVPPAPTPGPGPPASWTGTADTFSFTKDSNCQAGKSPTSLSSTTSMFRMSDGLSSCAKREQTAAGGGKTVYSKWGCATTDAGGILHATTCTDDACADCSKVGNVYSVSFIGSTVDQAACLNPYMSSDPSMKAFLLDPPTTGDPVYEAALAPCLVPPAPTPAPAPTPSPALTCDDCVKLDNMEW